MNFLDFPNDIRAHCLAFLEVGDLIKSLRVSRAFNACCKTNAIFLRQLEDAHIRVELDRKTYISFQSKASIKILDEDEEEITYPSITIGQYNFAVEQFNNGIEIATTFRVISGCPEDKRYDCIQTLLARLPPFITFIEWSSNIINESLLKIAALLPSTVVKFVCGGELITNAPNQASNGFAENSASQIVLEMLQANKHYSAIAFHDFAITFPADFFAKQEIQRLTEFKCYRISTILVDDDALAQAAWANIDFSQSDTPSLSTLGVARMIKEWKEGRREITFILLESLSTDRESTQPDDETAAILQRVNDVVNAGVEYELAREGGDKCIISHNKNGVVIVVDSANKN